MKRKVNKVGPTTLSITLPAKWVKTNNIKKGDELNIDLKNNSLTIAPEQLTIEETIQENIPATTEGHVKSIVNNIYRRGYDKAVLHFDNETTRDQIIIALHETMGFEVIEQKNNNITIKNLATPSEEEFNNLMRRAFLITLTIAEDGMKDIESGKIDINKYLQLKKTVEKLMNICCRTLNSSTLRNLPISKLTYLIIHTADKIAYDYYYILRHSQNNKITDKEVLIYYKKVTLYFRKFYDAYYGKDTDKVEELTREKDELLWKEGYDLIKNHKNAVVIHHLMNIVRRTYECASPFIGENLNVKTNSYTQ